MAELDELTGISGAVEPSGVNILKDLRPSRSAWNATIDSLVIGEKSAVDTHLAPLSPAQRRPLDGTCAIQGTRLVTPGDGGRNSSHNRSH